MAFTTTHIQGNIGFGQYENYDVMASFKVGGSTGLANAAWNIPGGAYTGDLVIT